MKRLFDQNASPRLAERLADLFPGSAHVSALNLDQAPDDEVWDFALNHGYVIVTKDADFNILSLVRGWPPKVIWLQLGNCTTTDIENAFRRHYDAIDSFGGQRDVGTLVISGSN